MHLTVRESFTLAGDPPREFRRGDKIFDEDDIKAVLEKPEHAVHVVRTADFMNGSQPQQTDLKKLN